MKILVCISKVPDTTSKINFVNENKTFDANGVQFIVNPYDEWYALVKALEIKEKSGADITLINVGESDNDAVIRKALAIGGDDAVRINASPVDAYFVAEQIAAYAKNNKYDVILTGKETIDFNGSVIGGMVAEKLNFPYISLATALELKDNVAVVEHDIDGGTQVVECELPLVISAQKGMAEARIPNMRGIMAARTKPLNVIEPVGNNVFSNIDKFELAQGRVSCKLISAESPEQLIDMLHVEAKAL